MTEYGQDRAALASLFPRGRFTRDEEDHCVLTARRSARARDFLYVQAAGHKLGIFYVGRGQVYRNALRGLIVEEIEADGEGIIHAKWVPEVAERLPWFSKRKGRANRTSFLKVGHGQEGRPKPSEGSGQGTEHREGTPASQEVTP